jgi:hypothetical protein
LYFPKKPMESMSPQKILSIYYLLQLHKFCASLLLSYMHVSYHRSASPTFNGDGTTRAEHGCQSCGPLLHGEVIHRSTSAEVRLSTQDLVCRTMHMNCGRKTAYLRNIKAADSPLQLSLILLHPLAKPAIANGSHHGH